MQKRSFLLRYATLTLLALMVARVCCASALPQPNDIELPARGTPLRFGQSLALADFDGDNHLDQATLGGAGRNKSIAVSLSQTKSRTLLHFDTLTSERGSLFTGDIDNDGDNDLIWSDLVHPDDVVIWLDDGTGRFERVCPDMFAKDFVLKDAPAFDDPESPQQEFALNPPNHPFSSLSLAHRINHFARTPVVCREWRRVAVQTCNLRTPFDRGPPSLLA